MNTLLTSKNKVVKNPHFYIVILMMVVIALFYCRSKLWFPWFIEILIFELSNNIAGSLFIVPIIYSIFLIKWAVPFIWPVFLIVMAIAPLTFGFSLWTFYSKMIFSITPITISVFFVLSFEWRRIQKVLEENRRKDRQTYLQLLSDAQENERQRIAQELHDGVIQMLVFLCKRERNLIDNNKGVIQASIRKEMESIRENTLDIVENVRRLSYDLRPSILDNIGLISAIRWLLDCLQKETKINANLVLKGSEIELPEESEIQVFRIVQEAINNVRQHSEANNVQVSIIFKKTMLFVEIHDNGRGFRTQKTPHMLMAKGKLGIIGMKQRAAFISGSFNIVSKVGSGTSIICKVPYTISRS